jgi:hypothetical protein
MERGGSSRRRSRRTTGEAAAAAAAETWGNGVDAGAAGSRQPYHECPFCRNGFTTAQALGGHMNLHRRDRAIRRPGRDAPATGTASVAAYPSSPPAPAMGSSFATYDYSGAAYVAADGMGYGSASQTELNLFGAPAATYGHADLSLGIGSRVPDGEAEGSLDLELRLGRHPSWGWQ